jgi:hypothetical protein
LYCWNFLRGVEEEIRFRATSQVSAGKGVSALDHQWSTTEEGDRSRTIVYTPRLLCLKTLEKSRRSCLADAQKKGTADIISGCRSNSTGNQTACERPKY